MNKVLKGLVAVAATAAMAVAGFAGASTAMAADPTGGIKVADGDTHTYSVYQILTGTYGTTGALGNVEAGTDFKTNNGAGDQGADLSPAEAAEALANINSSKSDQEKLTEILKFANLATQYGSDLTASAPLTNVPAGYYLAKDKDNTVTGYDAQTLYIVNVVGNSVVTINRKVDKPTFEKKVKDINDSTGALTGWQDSADYDVNDHVPFQLTATLPTSEKDFAAYKTYKLIFTDDQSKGLKYDEDSFTVKYVPTNEGRAVTLNAETYKKIVSQPTSQGDGSFTITIDDVKNLGLKDSDNADVAVTAGGKFVVEYTSTLTSSAVIGSEGNPNEAWLDYSNNPNYTGEGASSPTGETPKDKVIVFTYQLNVNKTFDQGNPGEGDMPEFTLYKKYKNGDNEDWKKVGDTITLTKGGTEEQPTYTGSFSRIDDGDYKLVESHTPAGYNTAADTLFTITADHDVVSNDPKLTSLKINQTKGDKIAGTVTANVVNKKGSNLPSTGGMGTVMLYVAGIAVFVLAGATLVMALRRRNA